MKHIYTDEERIRIARMHLYRSQTIKSLADEFGVSVSTIGRWVVWYSNQKLKSYKF